MDSSKLKAVLVAVIATILALWLGMNAATAQVETMAWVTGGTMLFICMLLGKRVYLIIPFLSAIALVLPLPGQLSTGMIGQMLFLGFAGLLFLLRKLPLKLKVTELEIWMIILAGCVLQAYIRNPVGMNIMGTQTVGAKPYIIFATSLASAAVLSALQINPKDLKVWVGLVMLGSILNFSIGAIGFLFPSIGYWLAASFMADIGGTKKLDTDGAFRIAFVKILGENLANWISSRKSPLLASFHPFWLPLILLTFALAGLSGYRAQMILIGLIFFVGVCYRGGFRGVVISCLLGSMALVFISIINIMAPLPMNIQRTLSFLPGTWSSEMVDETENSSDWRIEIWKDALLSDRWIQNKTFGDGLGFTREELNRIRDLELEELQNQKSRVGLTFQQESYLINGNYHSGPVHTIRTIGYVGLGLLLLAMFRLAVHAHRQIKRCRGTEWFPVALFLGIPLIVIPIHWTFVIGTFEVAIMNLMMGIAVVRLMQDNLPLPAYQKPVRTPYQLPIPEHRLAANKNRS